MWQRMPAFIREWSILIVGVLVILPLLYFSTHEIFSSRSTSSASLTNQNDAAAGSQTIAQPALPVPAAMVQVPQPNAAPSSPAATPAMSHERMAAAPAAAPAQTSGQATPAPKAAVAAASGDVAAGKLVFRKCQACHSLEPGKNGLGPSLVGIVGKKASSVAELQLFAGHEGQQPHLGCRHPRCLSVGSAEVGSRQQDAVSGTQDRE